MKIISRYLISYTTISIGVTLLALTALISVIDFIGELDDINESYTLSKAIIYTALDFAPNTYAFFSLAVLIGSTINFSLLADRSELLAFRIIGYTRHTIALILLKFSLILMLVMFAFGEIVVPYAVNSAYQLKHTDDFAQSQNIVHTTDNGNWTRLGRNYIFFKSFTDADTIKDAKIFQIDDAYKIQNTYEAQYVDISDEQLTLRQGRLMQIEGNVLKQVKRFDSYIIDNQGQADIFNLRGMTPQMLNIIQLYQMQTFLEQNMMNSEVYKLEFWKRFSGILTIPVMLLLALLWAFQPPRSDNTKKQLFIAVLLGIAYILFSNIVTNLTLIWNASAALGAFLPILLFLPFGVWAFKRLS